MKAPTAARRTTARRILGAFTAVLLLFAAALLVVVIALRQIGAAEDEVARLDHAKHAGHHAAGLARELYIHQAHTLFEWNDSHLKHYDEVAQAAAGATAHLRVMVDTPENHERAQEIARLVAESDRKFREEVVPVVGGPDRSRVGELHRMTEEPVERVVALNEELNRDLERRAEVSQERAASIRSQALVAVIGFFVLAIVAAVALGLYLLRSISGPVARLREGAQRIGGGDLGARVDLRGDDEIGALAGVFNQMAEDLAHHQAELIERNRLASIGQLAAGVAHEINNPIGVMLGYVMLLRKDAALADREELTIIEDELRQCQVIVAGLLDLARPVRLHPAEVDLDDLAREAVSRLEESGQLGGVSVQVDGAGGARVHADEGKIKQVVFNLLINAVDAARDKGARAPEVRVAARVEGGRAYVEIVDRGAGMPAEVKMRLFEPFHSTKPRGHGLGLAIARTLARAHGGDVELTDGPGGVGTRATVWIPQEAPKEPV
ncbi:MAG: HAMP domain-containing histidine kinase [Kofleriaceae bacterium]|nr:HAMP domain-containing histidine kinase [Kofleriaceae bacterium]